MEKFGKGRGAIVAWVGVIPFAIVAWYGWPWEGGVDRSHLILPSLGAVGFFLMCALIGSKIDLHDHLEANPEVKAITERWKAYKARGKSEEQSEVPDDFYIGRPNPNVMYGVGLIVILLSAAAMLLVWQVGSTFGGYMGIATLVLSILGLIAGVKVLKVGYNATEKYAKDVAHMTSVAQSLLQREIALVETSLVRHKLLMQHEFDQRKMQHELSLMDERLMTEQAKGQLDRQLTRAASSRGVDVVTLMLFERTLELDRMELEKQWALAEQSINAALIAHQVKSAVAAGLTPHQHLQTLREYINSLYQQSETTTDREKALLEKHIKFMESDFSARQRLIQADTRGKLQGSN